MEEIAIVNGVAIRAPAGSIVADDGTIYVPLTVPYPEAK